MNKIRLYTATAAVMMLTALSCGKSFLSTNPQGTIYLDDQLLSTGAVESSLIGAYAIMNGNISGTWGNYASAASQWLFAEVGGDNAHKGSDYTDQGFMNEIELHKTTPVNDQLPNMWTVYYEGVIRCNNTLKMLDALQNSDLDAPQKFPAKRVTEIRAEVRMLRAHYYFFLRRVFAKIPYLDETINTTTTTEANAVSNDKEVFPMIEADLKFAIDSLPQDYSKPGDKAVGRADKLAAQAYLGKVLLYQGKYTEALPLFKAVIAKKNALSTYKFEDNFDPKAKLKTEGIFVAQTIVTSDGNGENANVGDMLSGFYGSAPVNCCGFYLPSYDLVNAFRIDTLTGLPYLDGSYRTNAYLSDHGLTGTALDNYKVDSTIAFDPRLDFTVGRRGVAYRDWGAMPGNAWIRNSASGSPFVAYKTMINKADFGAYAQPGTLQVTAQNINIIRLSDVYLMAAECAIEGNDLASALDWVNAVRNRAATMPHDTTAFGNPAAKYDVKPYASFPDQGYARKAVRMERRLELALEGHRFFDLVRWGIAKETIDSYQTWEGNYTTASGAGAPALYQGYNGVKDDYSPIPQQEIDRSGGVLKPNGYGH